MNGYVKDITGYATSDFIGQTPLHTWGELVHPEDFQTVAATTTKAINSIYNLEYRILTESGEVKWVSEYGRHIDDPYTGDHLIDGIILDIDHKKRTQQILQGLNQKMEQQIADHTKSLSRATSELIEQAKLAALFRLSAGMTPILKAHLNKAIETSHTLSYQEAHMAPQVYDAFLNLQASLHLSINSLDPYSKVISINSNHDQVQIDLVQTIDNNMKLICALLAQEPQMFTLNTKNDEPILMMSSSNTWLQLLVFLTQNVIDHSAIQTQNLTRSIVISIEKTSYNIFVTFSDNGAGMSSHDANQAFEPFFTTKRHKGHSGLGLYVVQHLVVQYLKGTLSLNTDQNQGFSLTIKLNL